MIETYEIRGENENEILVLHLNFSYEFGSLWGHSVNKTIKEYIEKMKINFHGKKVLLVVGGVCLATIFLPHTSSSDTLQTYITSNTPQAFTMEQMKENEEDFITEMNDSITKQEEMKEIETIETTIHNEQIKDRTEEVEEQLPIVFENSAIDEQIPLENVEPIDIPTYKNPVTIYRESGYVTLEFEDYMIGVVAAEMPASFETEALKAQALVARTYAKKVLERGGTLTDSMSTQVYKDDTALQKMWGSNYNFYYNKVKDAVLQTEGLSIYYDGKLIDAVYHSTSNGFTEDAQYVWGNKIPYLKTVESPWDQMASSYLRTEEKSAIFLWNTLGLSIDDTTSIEIISKDESGRVTSIKVGDSMYDGITFRKLLNLRSTDFDLEIQNGNLVVTTKGFGHGVGMSQYGANGMAKEGYDCIDIVKHYYTGVSVY